MCAQLLCREIATCKRAAEPVPLHHRWVQAPAVVTQLAAGAPDATPSKSPCRPHYLWRETSPMVSACRHCALTSTIPSVPIGCTLWLCSQYSDEHRLVLCGILFCKTFMCAASCAAAYLACAALPGRRPWVIPLLRCSYSAAGLCPVAQAPPCRLPLEAAAAHLTCLQVHEKFIGLQ